MQPELTVPPGQAALGRATPGSRAARVMRESLSGLLWWIISIGMAIVVWEVAAALGWINTFILPPPHEIISVLSDETAFIAPQAAAEVKPATIAIAEAVLATVQRVLAGIALAFVLSLTIGSLAFYFRIFGNLTMPTIALLSPVAPIAWVPLAIVAFGIGDPAAVAVVFLGLFFILTLAVVNTMKGVDQIYLNTALVLGATRFQLLRDVILPATLPSMLVIIRVNFFAAWMAVLAAEAVGVGTGLGMVIWAGRQMLNMKLTFFGMALIGLVGFLIDQLFVQLQKRVLWWRTGAEV
jgi:NitT/TauT family transport system permease protein